MSAPQPPVAGLPLRPLPVDGRSLRQRVVRDLRSAIVAGALAPGERLVEEDISQSLGVSRGPVREALRQLEQEGLVTSYPYRGTVVLGVSEEEVQQVLIPIRLTLERFAAAKALHRMTDADQRLIDDVLEGMERAAAAGDLQGVVDLDIRFHEAMLTASGQPHTLQVWRTIEPRIRAYFQRHGRHKALHQIVAEHRLLGDAIRSRDEARLISLLDDHIRVTWVR